MFSVVRRLEDSDDTTTAPSGDNFQVDLTDSRFSALLAKDGRFGIDTTSTDFRARDSKEMKRLLAAQRAQAQAQTSSSKRAGTDTVAPQEHYKVLSKSQSRQEQSDAGNYGGDMDAEVGGGAASSTNAAHLAERLKKRFKK